MASAIVSEPQAHTDRGPLSLSLDTKPSSSPFPSPSSSFLPPPMPGAHEFALKPPKRASNANANGSNGSTVNTKRDAASESTSTAATPVVETPKSIPPPAVIVPTDPVPFVEPTSPSSAPSSPPAESGETTKTELPPSPASSQTFTSLHQLLGSGDSPPPSSSFTTPTASTADLSLTPQAEPSPGEAASHISTNPVVFTSPASASNSPTHAKKMSINVVASNNNNNNNWDDDNSGSGNNNNLNDPLPSPSISTNRPAPPSPAMSRRASSIRSTRSRGSRPPSQAISRTNSVRKSSGSINTGLPSSLTSSPSLNATPDRLSVQGTLYSSLSPVSLPSPQAESYNDVSSTSIPLPPQTPSTPQPPPSSEADKSLSTPTTAAVASDSTTTPTAAPTVYIKIRDYGFPSDDDRHHGLGPNVPRSNHVGRLNKHLRRGQRRTSTASSASASSSISTSEEEVEEDDDEDGGWGGFNFGQGRFNWTMGAGTATAGAGGAGGASSTTTPAKDGFPTQNELERNFGESGVDDELDDEMYGDADEHVGAGRAGGDDDDDEPLYPGLYRSLYSFVPEGTAEMALEEDQIIKVVGRGGGVGWAVVVKNWVPDPTNPESGLGRVVGGESQHALVPESYLEAVKLDWEDEEREREKEVSRAPGPAA